MLDTVVFEESWRNIKVSAYTDRYAYDPENGALLFMSLAGNEQAVKAISSAIVAGKMVSIGQEESEVYVHGNPASRYRILSTELPGGSLHQIVADARFYVNSDRESRLVTIPTGLQPYEAIYSQVLASLPSPMISVWALWLYGQLQGMDLITEMSGTLKVVEVRSNENVLDGIISEGIRMGRINFNEQGGPHAGVH